MHAVTWTRTRIINTKAINRSLATLTVGAYSIQLLFSLHSRIVLKILVNDYILIYFVILSNLYKRGNLESLESEL